MDDSQNSYHLDSQSMPQRAENMFDDINGNLLSEPSNCKKKKLEMDNIKIIRRYSSNLLRQCHQHYRWIKKLQYCRNQIKKIDDSIRQSKKKAQKETPLFTDRYLAVIKAKRFDFSNIEHIYIISSSLDPIFTLKEELGMGSKTIASKIKIDYQKISPGLLSMLNNATTIIIAQSANIHNTHNIENELNDINKTNILGTGSSNIKNNDDSINIPNYNDKHDLNKDFLCKILTSFNNNTGYVMSKTYSVCNCSNLDLLHDYSNNNNQSDTRSVPEEKASALTNEPINNVSDPKIDINKSKLLYENVHTSLIKNVNSEIKEKQELLEYDELYKKVTGQSTTRIEQIHNKVSVLDIEQNLSSMKSLPRGPRFTSPSKIMKNTDLGSSKESNNLHQTSIKKIKKKKKGKAKSRKEKRKIKAKSRKLRKFAKKQANSIKSEKCLSRFNKPKSSKKCIDIAEKLTICKSQMVSNIKTDKRYKDTKHVNNHNNVKPEPFDLGFTIIKNADKSTVKNSLKRATALCKKVVKFKSLIKEELSSIKSEPTEMLTDNTKNIATNRNYGSSMKASTLHEKNIMYQSLIKEEELNVKTEQSDLGTKITKNTAKAIQSGSSKGAFALRERIMNSKPLVRAETSNIKSEQSYPATQTTKSTAKGSHSGSSKGAFELHEIIVNSKPIIKGEQLNIKSKPYDPVKNIAKNKEKGTHSVSLNGADVVLQKITKGQSLIEQESYKQSEDNKSKKIHEVYTVEDKESNPSPSHTGLVPIKGNKSNISVSDDLPIEIPNGNLYCILHNSIIMNNYCNLDYAVAKNCDAHLIPLFNGECRVFVQYMGCICSIIVSRDTYVCINCTTIQCKSISSPINIYFDGILKSDGTIISIFVMWTGIKPSIFDSYRLINGNPETTDFVDIEGILCSRFDNKMIIKTHFDHNHFTFECSDSILSKQILNYDPNVIIPDNTNVSLYIRKTNQHCNNPIWTISWLILKL